MLEVKNELSLAACSSFLEEADDTTMDGHKEEGVCGCHLFNTSTGEQIQLSHGIPPPGRSGRMVVNIDDVLIAY